MENTEVRKFFTKLFWESRLDMLTWFRERPQYVFREQVLYNDNVLVMIDGDGWHECFWLVMRKKWRHKKPVLRLI